MMSMFPEEICIQCARFLQRLDIDTMLKAVRFRRDTKACILQHQHEMETQLLHKYDVLLSDHEDVAFDKNTRNPPYRSEVVQRWEIVCEGDMEFRNLAGQGLGLHGLEILQQEGLQKMTLTVGRLGVTNI